MTVVTNRTRPRAELRAAIYEAAIALFHKDGFTGTPVDAIVAAAGVAKGTFFNFFPTKHDVLKAYYGVIDAEVAHVRAKLNPRAPKKALSRYARDVEQILRREGALMLELIELTLSEPSMRRVDESSGALDAEEFAAFFARAQEHGAVGAHVDAAMAAEALVDLWSGAVRAWLRDPQEASLPALFDARVATLFAGLEGRI
ncbi:MAG: TetR/AcrR family transcriptional regulator [Vitreimonas sp.]